MTDRMQAFEAYRQRMRERALDLDHLGMKRFFHLDTAAYRDGVRKNA